VTSSLPQTQKKTLKCSEKFRGDTNYKFSQKLQVKPFGNCDYCEASITKVYYCTFCKNSKCQQCMRRVFVDKLLEML